MKTNERSDLDQAIRGYERGFYLRNDYYNGINYAFLLNERAVARCGFRGKRRRLCPGAAGAGRGYFDLPAMAGRKSAQQSKWMYAPKLAKIRYWVLATIAEAHIGLEAAAGQQRLDEAFAAAPETWMKESTQEQVDKLKILLAASPLKKLPGLT